jgi:glycosyltransferase involved in cell wall biosynthesis
MSTFNGERFLAEQLDSLLNQRDVGISIIIRDDGSSDGTRGILERYSARSPNIHVHPGTNLGVVPSFIELMRLASAIPAGYFALCDQDDVWLPEKLSRAVRALGTENPGPRLYCSVVRYVDESLRDLGSSRTSLRAGFDNAVVENIATGCTVVFNRALLDLVNSAPPRRALMHDWWLYMVAAAFGDVIFDPQSWILYRQHGRNVIGGTTSAYRMMVTRLRRFRLRQGGVFRCSDQAEEFLRCFGEQCPPDHRQVLQEMLAVRGRFFRRLRFAFAGRIRRNHWIDDGLLRVLLIAGHY